MAEAVVISRIEFKFSTYAIRSADKPLSPEGSARSKPSRYFSDPAELPAGSNQILKDWVLHDWLLTSAYFLTFPYSRTFNFFSCDL